MEHKKFSAWLFSRAMFLILIIGLSCADVFACEMCGPGKEHEREAKGMFSHITEKADIKNGVKEISYEQFTAIRNSGEKHRLLDVLSTDSYGNGHIEGAESFPLEEISKGTAEMRLSQSDNIIVYCGSFKCAASTEAAKKLSSMGYNVLDYKGGLKEWQEKGNSLVSKS